MFKRFLVLGFIIFLCGCSYHGEIENSAIVIGAAFDKQGEEIVLCVETVDTSSGKEKGAKGKVFTCAGETVFEVSEKMTTKAGKPLYWPHLKLIVISEEFANENIDELLSWVLKNAHARLNTPIAVFTGQAKNLLSLEPKTASFISDSLIDLIKANEKKGYTVNSPAYEIYNSLETEKETVLPLFSIEEEEPKIQGSIIFKNGKTKKTLSCKETAAALKGEDYDG